MPVSPPSRTSRRRLLTLLAVGLGLTVALALVRPRIAQEVRFRSVLGADTLDSDTLDELVQTTPDPGSVLTALWDSGKVAHRRAVFARLAHSGAAERPFPAGLRTRVFLEAATDPDHSLRESALGLLGAFRAITATDRPTAERFIRQQLVDADPELRRLGLQTLRHAGDAGWTPAILPLLDDSEPSVALAADALLRRWSGRDSGLRLTNALPSASSLIPRELDETTRRRLATLRAEWQPWWDSAAKTNRLIERAPDLGVTRRPVADFALTDLEGRTRSLSEFRGRTVLLNFWATWCGSCFAEFPVLLELQRRHANDLVIVGISLDSLTQGPLADTQRAPASPAAELQELRKLVRVAAGRSRLTYPILLDPANAVGRRFDGHELPTQVLIDAEGRLARRLVGGRSLDGWESLLAEARRPGASPR